MNPLHRLPLLPQAFVLLALLSSGLAAQVGRGLVAETSAPERPNVLLVLADDVGIDHVGVYAASYPGVVPPCTPNVDAFASTAVRFTNAWSSPVCSPTRAQILTGRRSRHHGLGHVAHWFTPKRFGLQPGIPTLPLVLDGYSTGAVGKWHLTDPFLGPTHPRDVGGFEHYRGSLWNLDGPFCLGYDDWLKTVLDPASGVQFQSFTYATTDTTQEALDLMASLPQPWFLYVAYHAAHSPYHCPHEEGYDPASCSTGCDPAWCSACDPNGPLTQTYGRVAAPSRAMTEALDADFGRLLAAIDPGSTAVFFLGDNGSEAQATLPPFRRSRAKATMYQAGINVPLLARVPGGVPGTNHELVSTTDLFATVAELAGESLPNDPLRDSVSLVPYLTSTAPADLSLRPLLYSEFFEPNFRPDVEGNPPSIYTAAFHFQALRNERFKLIQLVRRAGVQLDFYRLADAPPQDPAFGPDPFEYQNLLLDRTVWTSEEQEAYDELTLELATSYRPLPVGDPPAPTLRTAALDDDGTVQTATCDDQRLRVSFEETAGTARTERAYLDFDVSGVPTNSKILEARLELVVIEPALRPATNVQVCRVPGSTQIFSCAELFHVLDGSLVYATEPGWTAPTTKKSIVLSGDALVHLENAIPGGVFTLGLRLELEDATATDRIELAGAATAPHRLRITYTPR